MLHSYKVRTKNFEGPFDLLVYLTQKNQMDIWDIEISKITKDYLETLDAMKEEGEYISPEFLVLAATLMEIKSYMLLPHSEEELEKDPENPKTLLQRKLAEYKKFRELSFTFSDLIQEGLAVRSKPKEDYYEVFGEQDELLKMPMEKFISSFMLFLEKKQNLLDIQKKYARLEQERESQETRISHIAELFDKLHKERISFNDTLSADNKEENVLSFVSILEMYKENLIDILQESPFGKIELVKL
jgi:segregation and condensation protein A